MNMRSFNSFTVPRKGGMHVDVQVTLLPGESLDADVADHLRNAASLPTAMRVIGLPNLGPEQAFISGCAIATGGTVLPGLLGHDINAGTRLIGTTVKAADVRVRRIEQDVRKAVPFGDKSTNLRLHEGDFRLLLEFGIMGIGEVTDMPAAFKAVRDEVEEESDSRKAENGGSILTNSASVSHNAIERGQHQLGTAGGAGHFIDLFSVEGIFDDRAGKEIALFKDQLVVCFSAGSRSFGYQVVEDYTALAREMNGDKAPESALSSFDERQAEACLQAIKCAVNFGFVNRQLITALIRNAVRMSIGRKAMPLICDVPHTTLRDEQHGQKELWVHRRRAARVVPAEEVSPHKPGTLTVLSGSPAGATYILAAGENAASTLNSLSVDTGMIVAGSGERTSALHRNVDQIVRCLVDSGLARIIARLKPLASIH